MPLPALAWAALGLGGLWAAKSVLSPKPRFLGDLAKAGPIASADQVEVMVPDLIRSNASLTIGAGAGQIPSGTASVLVSVLGANKDVLQGPIVAFGTVPTKTPLGSVVVNRADVKALVRGGKVRRSLTGQFAGENYQKFVG